MNSYATYIWSDAIGEESTHNDGIGGSAGASLVDTIKKWNQNDFSDSMERLYILKDIHWYLSPQNSEYATIVSYLKNMALCIANGWAQVVDYWVRWPDSKIKTFTKKLRDGSRHGVRPVLEIIMGKETIFRLILKISQIKSKKS